MPQQILSRMDEELYDRFGLHREWQHRLVTDEKDPRSGMVEVAKNGVHNKKFIEDWLVGFYGSENYKVLIDDKNRFTATSKDNKSFRLNIFETDTSFVVSIESTQQS